MTITYDAYRWAWELYARRNPDKAKRDLERAARVEVITDSDPDTFAARLDGLRAGLEAVA